MWACAVALIAGAVWVEAPAFDRGWDKPPARFEVDETIRNARVIDQATMVEIPCKVQQQRDKRYVYWTRTEDGSQPHRYQVEFNAASLIAPPVFVGAEDMLSYGKVNAVADLGVGLWATAIPVDWDGDGDWDLLYTCQDVPQSGVYLYIQEQAALFRCAQRLGDGIWHLALADMNGDGKIDLLAGDAWYDDIRANGMSKRIEGPLTKPEGRYRDFMARQVDWDGDGVLDLVSAGGEWGDYGWDQAFDSAGNWTRGPLHGYVWFHKNTGTHTDPQYAEKAPLEADDRPIDVYGGPCPCFADFDGDGDLDLICGEFRDEFTYFENVGTPTAPRLAAPRAVLGSYDRLRAGLCMISPQTCDWNGDGRPDLIVGQEDGRVSVHLHRGLDYRVPRFTEEKFLRELEPPIKSGALVTPWLDPATRSLYCGNTAGYIEWFQWLRNEYKEGRYVRTGNEPLRVQAGYNGSVQGPAEEKWGYTVPVLGDLDNDGQDELVYNSILGRIEFVKFLDNPERVGPRQAAPVTWSGDPPYPAWNWWKPEPHELIVQWRTRPLVVDWDGDGLNDLVALDHEGYLALYRFGEDTLLPGERVFLGEDGQPLRLNDGAGGKSGRAKIHFADWDQDGDLDLIRNTQNTGWFENTGNNTFTWRGDFPLRKLAGHTTAPIAVDWNGDGILDLLVGAEDGRIYCYHRAAIEQPDKLDARTSETIKEETAAQTE